MWRIVGALLLISSASFAQQPVLRFSVPESWTMAQEQPLACLVRNDPALPVQGILQALLRLKASGEIERMIERYTHIRGHPPQSSSPPPS
ncbi:hypothetical protein [Pseudomonas sp. B21-032]|uniref:hypothetical protein n=1 Tax=Pseudomonas sp. B21-032 TaxID=2895483 RepID=UPI0038D3F436